MKHKILKLLFFLLCIFELLLISFLRNFAGPINSPVYLLLTSVCIALLYYQLSPGRKILIVNQTNSPGLFLKLIPAALFTALSILIAIQLNSVIHTFPISKTDTTVSDIIPQTEYLAQRFLAGEKPYQEIQFHGYELFPTYLPLQWLPYLICEWLNFDYRWLAAFVLWFVSFLFFIRYYKNPGGLLPRCIVPCWPLIIWLILIQYDKMQFAFMLESLLAGYYLFTCLGFTQAKKIGEATGITICLLSRYAIILWVPFYFLKQLLDRNYKKFLFTGSFVCLAFIVIYWWPFLRQDSSAFLRGYAYHTNAAIGEWQHVDIRSKPVHLYNGLGFASWGYKYIHSDSINHKLDIWQKIHFCVSLFTVVILSLIYWIKRKTIKAKQYLIMSFKIYLIVFYAFIQIPYAYLFIVPLIITSVFMAEVFCSREANDINELQSIV